MSVVGLEGGLIGIHSHTGELVLGFVLHSQPNYDLIYVSSQLSIPFLPHSHNREIFTNIKSVSKNREEKDGYYRKMGS